MQTNQSSSNIISTNFAHCFAQKVITVFRTDKEWLKKGLTDYEGAPIARLLGTGNLVYPFVPLADPEGTAADVFCVEHKSRILHAINYMSMRRELMRYHNTSHISSSTSRLEKKTMVGACTILPTELLINENGVLIDVLRAHNTVESMTMERISHFLLSGKKLPDEKESEKAKRRLSMPLRRIKVQRSIVADEAMNINTKRKRHTVF